MFPIRAKRLRRLFLALPCLAPVSSARAVDSVVLKPRYDGPTEAYVEFDTDSVQKMSGPGGNPMEIKSRSVYGLLQKTTPKGDTVAIEATLDRLLGFMAFGESVQSFYDTDDPDYQDASPMHRDTFGPILNMPLKITLNKTGLATAVVGAEQIRRKLKAMGEQNFVAKSLAEGDFTDRRVMSNFGEGPSILYPFRTVNVGDTWKQTQKDEYPQVGKVIVNYDCTLDRIEKSGGRELAIVAYKGTITKDHDEKPAKDQRLGKIDGMFTGTAKFDVQQGRCVEIVRESNVKIEVPPWWT
ncbi:MAG: DUF6263 family protein, partial [Planctomycetaceae bacterium]